MADPSHPFGKLKDHGRVVMRVMGRLINVLALIVEEVGRRLAILTGILLVLYALAELFPQR